MRRSQLEYIAATLLAGGLLGGVCTANAAIHIEGEVQAGGRPLANSTVTLGAGSSGEPRQLAQTKAAADGRFQLTSQEDAGTDSSLYLIAQSGDNSAVKWLSVLGNAPPAKASINELTTVASVWLIVGDMLVTLKTGGNGDEVLTRAMFRGDSGGGSVSMLRPDGSQYPGSPFTGGGLTGPWAAAIDGNDNVWISNFAAANSPIVELCGARTETCPLGLKTGDQISPPGGYVGGGLQMQTDLAISPSGDVWVMNNWEDIDSCFGVPSEVLSTRCGGQGVTIFFGMAKPVRPPQIGPARALGDR